jgi:hypothetical protein
VFCRQHARLAHETMDGVAAPPAACRFASSILLGAYYAATDGVLMAVAGGMLLPALRGSGFALVTMAMNRWRSSREG